jgi:hypothetical protein
MRFDDGVERTIDFKEILHGTLLAPLSDNTFFNKVRLDPELKTIVWPNGADFDPETLHNWDNYKDAWLKETSEWKEKEAVHS